MKRFTFRELRDGIKDDFEDYKNDFEADGIIYTNDQVAGRSLVELTTVINQGYTEELISYATVGRYIVANCSEEMISYNRGKLLEVLGTYDRNKLDNDITKEEIQELEKDINFVLDALR